MRVGAMATTRTEQIISAVKIKCTCGNPQSHIPDPCPQGIKENLGVIAFYNDNPSKRVAFWVAEKLARYLGMILVEKEKES